MLHNLGSRDGRRPTLSRWTHRRHLEVPAGAPPPDLVVTGSTSPATAGNYYESGTYYGKPKYACTTPPREIWWNNPGGTWALSDWAGSQSPYWWEQVPGDPNSPTGSYEPRPMASGTATVSTP